jgi:hypothetical protein
VVPELMQNEMREDRLASEALKLLNDPAASGEMRHQLEIVSHALAGPGDPIGRAACAVDEILGVTANGS